MKKPNFNHISLDQPIDRSKPQPRTQKEDLIEQIVAQCSFKKKGDDRELAKLLAIATNTLGWTEQDLHALMKKKQDPTIRNYTAFVWWSAKITRSCG